MNLGNPLTGVARYYPFGMVMPGRQFNTVDYRYGYNNGSEKDDEISGSGHHFTTYWREGDTRLLTWWSPDPYHQFSSPYNYMGNNPINGIDPNGSWFWETKQVRNARKHARQTGGDFEKLDRYNATVKSTYNDPSSSIGKGVDFVHFGPSQANRKGMKADAALTKWFDNHNVSWFRPERLIHNGGAVFFGYFQMYDNSRILDIHLQLSPFSNPTDANSETKDHWKEYERKLTEGNSDFIGGFGDDQMALYIKAHNIDLSGILDKANSSYYSNNTFFNDMAGNTIANSFLFGAYNFGTIFNAPVRSEHIKTLSLLNATSIRPPHIGIKYNPQDWGAKK